MKRKIVRIDEEKCDGCGLCVDACHEGALQLIDGKARLVSESYCDGLGNCLPECPAGAITIEEREASAFDAEAVEHNVKKHMEAPQVEAPKEELACGCHAAAPPVEAPQEVPACGCHAEIHTGRAVPNAALTAEAVPGEAATAGVVPGEEPESLACGCHAEVHTAEAVPGEAATAGAVPGEEPESLACGCPGTSARVIERGEHRPGPAPATTASESQLRQWPCQIKLVPVNAPYLDNARLLVAADCTAYAYANMHQDFMRNRITLIGCPKLDDIDYTEKLTEILKAHEIRDIIVLRMEVPCCGGIVDAVKQALKSSGKMIPWQVVTIGTDGSIIED